MKVGDWRVKMENLTRATLQDFFHWVCERHNIESWGSSQVYIRQFLQLHTTVTGRYCDRNDIKELYKVLDSLNLAVNFSQLFSDILFSTTTAY